MPLMGGRSPGAHGKDSPADRQHYPENQHRPSAAARARKRKQKKERANGEEADGQRPSRTVGFQIRLPRDPPCRRRGFVAPLKSASIKINSACPRDRVG